MPERRLGLEPQFTAEESFRDPVVPSLGNESVSSVESIQSSETEKAETIETAQKGRQRILQDWVGNLVKSIEERIPEDIRRPIKSILSNNLNDAGPIGTFKQTQEAIKGQTWDGKKLTPVGRLNHIVVQGLFVYAWQQGLQGDFETAGAAYAASWAFDIVQYYPNTISGLISLAEKYGKSGVTDKLIRLKEILDKSILHKAFFEDTSITNNKE